MLEVVGIYPKKIITRKGRVGMDWKVVVSCVHRGCGDEAWKLVVTMMRLKVKTKACLLALC